MLASNVNASNGAGSDNHIDFNSYDNGLLSEHYYFDPHYHK